jgi:hypothetical protein
MFFAVEVEVVFGLPSPEGLQVRKAHVSVAIALSIRT